MTEEQWNLMLNYIKARRIGIPFLLLFALLSMCFACKYWQLGNKYLTKAVLHQNIVTSPDNQKELISLSPEEIKYHFKHLSYFYAMGWGQCLLSVQFLTFFVISVTFGKLQKTHRILLSRPSIAEVEK
ncbi:MAG: hypothetical protein ABII09_02290 [Planctomycetota bacterium]